jgi:hypothetical protein
MSVIEIADVATEVTAAGTPDVGFEFPAEIESLNPTNQC